MLEFLSQFAALAVFPTLIILAITFGLFLFWRAASYELYSSREIFDIVFVWAFGSFILGRIFHFLLNPDIYNWSLKKLIFFNIYWGIDFYGGILGAILTGIIVFRKKKDKIINFLDLSSAPIAFTLSLFSLINFFKTGQLLNIAQFFALFIVFWSIKRLETEKKHQGFIFSFFIISVSLIRLLFAYLENRSLNPSPKLIMPLLFSMLFSIIWYLIAKRNIKNDIKNLMALSILVLLGFKLVITSVKEADKLAKNLILIPYTLAKSALHLVKLLGQQINLSLIDLIHALGVKK